MYKRSVTLRVFLFNARRILYTANPHFRLFFLTWFRVVTFTFSYIYNMLFVIIVIDCRILNSSCIHACILPSRITVAREGLSVRGGCFMSSGVVMMFRRAHIHLATTCVTTVNIIKYMYYCIRWYNYEIHHHDLPYLRKLVHYYIRTILFIHILAPHPG